MHKFACSSSSAFELFDEGVAGSFNSSNAANNLEPLKSLTQGIVDTYTKCNSSFRSVAKLPRRLLTNPSEGVSNDGNDNREHNLICRVNDKLVNGSDSSYTILDSLGTGTFGQVFRCQKDGTKEIVAVKVIKNKVSYYNQGLIEIKLLRLLNNNYDPKNQRHIVRLQECFEYKSHICVVFELLNMSLLDILTQNQFRGLPLAVVQRFTRQILSALVTLQDADIIHCDLKPENILLALPSSQQSQLQRKSVKGKPSSAPDYTPSQPSIQSTKPPSASAPNISPPTPDSPIPPPPSAATLMTTSPPPDIMLGPAVTDPTPAPSSEEQPKPPSSSSNATSPSEAQQSNGAQSERQGCGVLSDVKVIDFGSACVEGATMFSYIQSRFYRSPEVLLGVPYNGAIDMWSLACVCAEMYLGLPLFPGVSQHNQISRIVEMLGPPPDMLIEGKNGLRYFTKRAKESSPAAREMEAVPDPTAPPDVSPPSTATSVLHGHLSPSSKYRLKTPEEYARETNTDVPVLKKYLRYSRLEEVIMRCPLANKAKLTVEQKTDEMQRRKCFLHFLQGLFVQNPFERWTAQQAATHPFITNAPFVSTFHPPIDAKVNERKLTYLLQIQQKTPARHTEAGQAAFIKAYGQWPPSGTGPSIGTAVGSTATNFKTSVVSPRQGNQHTQQFVPLSRPGRRASEPLERVVTDVSVAVAASNTVTSSTAQAKNSSLSHTTGQNARMVIAHEMASLSLEQSVHSTSTQTDHPTRSRSNTLTEKKVETGPADESNAYVQPIGRRSKGGASAVVNDPTASKQTRRPSDPEMSSGTHTSGRIDKQQHQQQQRPVLRRGQSVLFERSGDSKQLSQSVPMPVPANLQGQVGRLTTSTGRTPPTFPTRGQSSNYSPHVQHSPHYYQMHQGMQPQPIPHQYSSAYPLPGSWAGQPHSYQPGIPYNPHLPPAFAYSPSYAGIPIPDPQMSPMSMSPYSYSAQFAGSMQDNLLLSDFGQALLRPEMDEHRRMNSMQYYGYPGAQHGYYQGDQHGDQQPMYYDNAPFIEGVAMSCDTGRGYRRRGHSLQGHGNQQPVRGQRKGPGADGSRASESHAARNGLQTSKPNAATSTETPTQPPVSPSDKPESQSIDHTHRTASDDADVSPPVSATDTDPFFETDEDP